MTKYRSRLPQLNGTKLLTDGGLETVMVFQEGVALPLFAAFRKRHVAGKPWLDGPARPVRR